MKLSKNTLDHLKHFSTINPNFLFQKGVEQTTIAGSKSRIVATTLDTSFPLNFPIRDLGIFLKAVSSLNDPDIKFTKSKLTISGDDGKISFKKSDIKNLILPSKKITFPATDIEFDINKTQFSTLINSLKRNHFYDVVFKGDGRTIIAKSETSHREDYVYEQSIGKTDKKFSFRFVASNLICPIDDYKVSISKKMIARFQSKSCDYISYIAVEKPRPQ
jgi:hypothetical protein